MTENISGAARSLGATPLRPGVVLALRVPDPDAVGRHPADIWPVPATDERRSRLGPRNVRVRARRAESGMGPGAAVCRHDRRQIRRRARRHHGQSALCARPAVDGLCRYRARARSIGRRVDRPWLERHDVRGGHGCRRPRSQRGKTQHGAGHSRGRRIVGNNSSCCPMDKR